MNNYSPSIDEYAALGMFVSQCSVAEICLHAAARNLADISSDVARLIVGEPRIGDLVQLIKNLAELKKIDDNKRAIIKNALSWIEFSNRVRSIVAHKPVLKSGVFIVFHNTVTAKKPTSAWAYQCTSDQLINLTKLTAQASEQLTAMLVWPKTEPINFPLAAYDASPSSLEKLGLPPSPESIQQKNQK